MLFTLLQLAAILYVIDDNDPGYVAALINSNLIWLFNTNCSLAI